MDPVYKGYAGIRRVTGKSGVKHWSRLCVRIAAEEQQRSIVERALQSSFDQLRHGLNQAISFFCGAGCVKKNSHPKTRFPLGCGAEGHRSSCAEGVCGSWLFLSQS